MPAQPQPLHPDFDALGASWELALRADGYAANTLRNYPQALKYLARWMAEHHPEVGPLEMDRDQMRGWVVHARETTSSGTARGWFAGVRHFARWLVAEKERADDFTEGIKTPKPNDVLTPILTVEQIRSLLATCAGTDFVDRRDRAILFVFIDGGLRLSEVAALKVDDADVRDRVLFVHGKGTNRSGPRRRAVPLGIKAAQSLDRYLRERRKHTWAQADRLWLGARNRPAISADGIEAMVLRRAARAGVKLTPHYFRHTWASAFRSAEGSEGDLMVLGGWRSRAMLDRYGKAAAAERAHEAYRQRAFGDRL